MSALFITHAPVPNPRGTVVVVHGLGEHSGRYGHVVAELQAARFSVITYDHRGHGRSPGARGAIPKKTTLLEDLAEILDLVPNGPRVLLGHSMGGTVAARFVAEGLEEVPAPWHRRVDALILSSPALRNTLSRGDRIKLTLARTLAPNVALPNALDVEKISHDPAVVHAYKTDPLIHDRVSARLADFVLQSGTFVRERASRWRVPTLLLFAGDDALVDARGSRGFAVDSPGEVVRAQEFPDLYHELFNETEPARSAVFALMREWLATVVQ
jgi:alpha-beta hydrolase superfamily lysophospholipase